MKKTIIISLISLFFIYNIYSIYDTHGPNSIIWKQIKSYKKYYDIVQNQNDRNDIENLKYIINQHKKTVKDLYIVTNIPLKNFPLQDKSLKNVTLQRSNTFIKKLVLEDGFYLDQKFLLYISLNEESYFLKRRLHKVIKIINDPKYKLLTSYYGSLLFTTTPPYREIAFEGIPSTIDHKTLEKHRGNFYNKIIELHGLADTRKPLAQSTWFKKLKNVATNNPPKKFRLTGNLNTNTAEKLTNDYFKSKKITYVRDNQAVYKFLSKKPKTRHSPGYYLASILEDNNILYKNLRKIYAYQKKQKINIIWTKDQYILFQIRDNA